MSRTCRHIPESVHANPRSGRAPNRRRPCRTFVRLCRVEVRLAMSRFGETRHHLSVPLRDRLVGHLLPASRRESGGACRSTRFARKVQPARDVGASCGLSLG
jgi:hypothetical protein